MGIQTRVTHPIYSLLPTEVEGFDPLAELALDMRWSWNHAADKVWLQLDPALWELTHNPWVVLQTVSRARLPLILLGQWSQTLAKDTRGLVSSAARVL